MKSSGKSRADLWAFATLVAVESGINENNLACDNQGRCKRILSFSKLYKVCANLCSLMSLELLSLLQSFLKDLC